MNKLNYSIVLNNIRKELKDYIVNNNIKSLVLGISGGIDSAVVASIAKPVCDELQIPFIGRSITIGTNKEDEILRSKLIGDSFCTDFEHINMEMGYILLQRQINPDIDGLSTEDLVRSKIRNGNIKARLRMITLYNLASMYNGMVLGTENRSEEEIGFFTIAGDETSDFEPIQQLWKTEVYELSEWMVKNDLKSDKEKTSLKMCIDAVATDGLGITNSDLDQILPGFQGTSRDGYKKVDEILKNWIYNGIGNITNPVIQRHIKSEFKRNRPYVVKREKLI